MEINGVKVFSATKARERRELGDRVTRWLQDNPSVRPLDACVTQSSCAEFHCLTITIFFREVA
jgi:hypothetical protein